MTIQRKFAPYIFIAVLCLIGSMVRLVILTGFPWFVHVFGYFGQFIVMSIIWQLIGFINRNLEKRFSLEQKPATHIFLQVIITLCLLSPVFIVSFLIAKPYLPSFVDNRIILMASALLLMVLMVMTFGYYTYELVVKNKIVAEEKSKLQLESAQLEKEKSLMQYHHLRNQVNPHFLFNTFSSLDGLIQSDPELASAFVRHLSKVYRYVLEHKENELVQVETELNFIQHYVSLLDIRYGNAINICLNVSKNGKEKGLVMVTLQMLIDNAIKHNVMQSGTPLKIKIWDEDGYLNIRNNKQLRKQIETSNQQGLTQLVQLYSYLSPLPVKVNNDFDFFEVKLPLL